MRIRIDGKTYDAKGTDRLSIRHALEFDATSRREGWGWTWAEVEEVLEEVSKLKTDAERRRHPGTVMVLALTIWAARVDAGDEVSFLDVVSTPFGSYDFIPEPGDHKESEDPRKARPTRKGSGRAASAPAVEPTQT